MFDYVSPLKYIIKIVIFFMMANIILTKMVFMVQMA